MSTDIPNTEATGYEGLADTYKKTKQLTCRVFFEFPTVEFLLQEISPGGSVLDLGCGGGFYLSYILKRKASVEAIDLSEDQIALAQQEFGDHPQVKLSVADARYYRSSKIFDVVTGFWLLNYAATRQDLEQFLETIAISMKPDGVFVGVNDNPFNCEQAYPGYQKYGFIKECEPPRREGSKVIYNIFEPTQMKITNYWWKPETYQAAALSVGLKLEFLPVHSAKDVSSNPEFWQFFQENPPFIAIKARKI